MLFLKVKSEKSPWKVKYACLTTRTIYRRSDFCIFIFYKGISPCFSDLVIRMLSPKGLLENSKAWKVLKNETSSPLFHSHKQHRVYSHAFWNRKSKRIQCVPLWLDKHATELTSIILASQTVQKMNIVNNEWREGHKTERTDRSDICFTITQTTNYPINQ